MKLNTEYSQRMHPADCDEPTTFTKSKFSFLLVVRGMILAYNTGLYNEMWDAVPIHKTKKYINRWIQNVVKRSYHFWWSVEDELFLNWVSQPEERNCSAADTSEIIICRLYRPNNTVYITCIANNCLTCTWCFKCQEGNVSIKKNALLRWWSSSS